MKKPFFKEYGNEICFEDRDDLDNKLAQIDCSVPGRTRGRRILHRERRQIIQYLKILSQNNLLQFPLCIKKSESPDFLLKYDKGTRIIGLETTEAGSEEHQKIMTESQKSGKGWEHGKGPDDWRVDILGAIQKKTQKLDEFKEADRYELLIYDNTGIPLAKEEIERGLHLQQSHCLKIRNQNPLRHFERISILQGGSKIKLWIVNESGINCFEMIIGQI